MGQLNSFKTKFSTSLSDINTCSRLLESLSILRTKVNNQYHRVTNFGLNRKFYSLIFCITKYIHWRGITEKLSGAQLIYYYSLLIGRSINGATLAPELA